MKSIALTLLLAAFCILAPSSIAQTDEVRTVPLAVLNSVGRVHMGLTAQDIRVKGVKAEIRNVTFDAGPRRIILLLDMSGSMAEPLSSKVTKWDSAKEMAKGLLRITLAQDLVALDIFSDKEKQIVPFTHDFASIGAAIDGLATKPYGRTAASDALHAALLDFGESPAFGDSVIFVSDGELDSDPSHRPLDSRQPDVAARSARVFLLLTSGEWLAAAPDQFMGDVSILDFMIGTGGYSFVPKSAPDDWPSSEVYRSDPGQRMIALVDAVQGTYRVQLQLNEPIRKKQKLRFELAGDHQNKPTQLSLFYPRAIYPDVTQTP